MSELIDLMKEALPLAQRRDFDRRLAPAVDAGEKYRQAATFVKLRMGDDAVAKTIRRAVLRACDDYTRNSGLATDLPGPNACRQLELEGNWTIPRAHLELAKFYASLPGDIRGPIVTTNFDPFIEMALRRVGLGADSIPVSLDNAPTLDHLKYQTGVPVLHLHGYWTEGSLSNTVAQLSRPQPTVRGLLRQLLTNSTVLVLGYGGWNDSFTRALNERVIERDLYESEICWATYSNNVAEAQNIPAIASMAGNPGFNLYLGIDATTLFDGIEAAEFEDETPAPSPYGYLRIQGTQKPRATPAVEFADGGEPTWADASPGSWPVLNAAEEFTSHVLRRIDKESGGTVAAIGPVGEGKSMALRQAAVAVASSNPDWAVFWRDAAAPMIDGRWIEEVQSRYGNVAVFVDEADLVLPQLLATEEARLGQPGVIFCLASHDRLWWSQGGHRFENADVTVFSGLTKEDAEALAAAYVAKNLVDAGSSENAVTSVATELLEAAEPGLSGGSSSLFGAILEVRYGPLLRQRVEDLIDKLSAAKIDDAPAQSLSDIFGAICLIQVTYDAGARSGLGTSRVMLAAMAGQGRLATDQRVLSALGKEAAISFAGDQIYARHPAIARVAVDVLRERGELKRIAGIVGRIGGELRLHPGVGRDHYNRAYLISRELEGDESDHAASGAVKGAHTLLEPRITRISVLRRTRAADALVYAQRVAEHAGEFEDYSSALRVFLNEYANVLIANSQFQSALGVAALALDDECGYYLDRARCEYALGSVARAADGIRSQNAAAVGPVVEISHLLLTRISGQDVSSRFTGPLVRSSQLDVLKDQSSSKLCSEFCLEVNPFARAAISSLGLSVPVNGTLRLGDLGRLADSPARAARREG
ncbi:SIR2 family protein [Isoptericola nanjingensis]|uniref:P-loop NTPase n=1 Tax=Isoptericola nanjingensis TaxID=903413 RepID=UPI003D2579B9